MRDALVKVLEALEVAESIGLATHIDPDGDALGATLGMGLMLKAMGKRVFIRFPEGQVFPPQYAFLPGHDLASDTPQKADAFVALDCGSASRVGNLAEEISKVPAVINIDHHPDNDLFGTVNAVDPGISSTSEIIYELAKLAGVEFDRDLALCLYVGIVTDTGRFQYSNTKPRTHLVAADLIAKGRINVAEVFHLVYEQLSFGSLKLMSAVVNGAEFIPEVGLMRAVLTRRLVKETGGRLEELESLIDQVRMVKDAEVTVLARELQDGRYRISLRSKGAIDVSKIARELGGGGHRNAAAYLTDKPLDESFKMLEARIMAQRGA